MKYKLVAIDLDDTLLKDDLTISERVKKAIKASIDKGILVTFATGRMYALSLPYAFGFKFRFAFNYLSSPS